MLVSARKGKIIDKCSSTSGIYHLAHLKLRVCLFFLKWLIGGLFSNNPLLPFLLLPSQNHFYAVLFELICPARCWSHSHKHWLQLFMAVASTWPRYFIKSLVLQVLLGFFLWTLAQNNGLKLTLNFWVMIWLKKDHWILENTENIGKLLWNHFGCWNLLLCRMCFKKVKKWAFSVF